uniref:Uncharacterized protein n=1 Tax=Arundo donax TaxID=35708 RepID=A0A0A8ZUR2_ARUDO
MDQDRVCSENYHYTVPNSISN